jgi:hypothetical protein
MRLCNRSIPRFPTRAPRRRLSYVSRWSGVEALPLANSNRLKPKSLLPFLLFGQGGQGK